MTYPSANLLPLGFIFGSAAMAWAGVGLISIPIIIHILNRRRFKTVTWAAMEFLMRAMRKNRRRLEFEQWLLLATRCLLVLLFGLALARPMGCNNALAGRVGGRSGLNVFIIDNSYSMAYQAEHPGGGKTHLDQAKKISKALIEQFSRGESVSLITAAAPIRTDGPGGSVMKVGYDLDRALSAVDRIEQSYGGTDLYGSLKLALQLAHEDNKEQNKTLYILSDGTRGAWESQAAGIRQLAPELAKTFKITHYNLSEGKPQSNTAVLNIAAEGGLVKTKFESDFAAAAKSFGSATEAAVHWQVDEDSVDDIHAKLSEEADPVVSHKIRFSTGGPHVVTVNLPEAGDRLPLDNVRYRVEDVAADLKVLVVEGKRGAGVRQSSGQFLQTALSPVVNTPGQAPRSASYVAAEVASDLELGNKVLSDYSAVILTDVPQITGPQADRLQQFVQQGGTLMLFMGDSVNKESYNAMLLPRKLMPGPMVKMMSIGTDQTGFRFDFKPNAPQNEFLQAFAGVPDTGLDLVTVSNYWQVEVPPGANVQHVLDYTAPQGANKPDAKAPADPAITVQPLGEGRVVFVSTSANDDWTNFPAHPAYVPLMHELLSRTVRSGSYWMNLEVGQPLVVPPAIKLTAAPTLQDSSKRSIVLEPVKVAVSAGGAAPTGEVSDTEYRSVPLTRPGIYTLSLGNRTVPIAVNIPAAESDVRTMNDPAIRKALGDIDVTMQGAEAPTAVSVQQAGRDFGWDFMVAVLVLLGVECFLAMRFGHYRNLQVKH